MADTSNSGLPMIGRIGLTVVGTAMFCPMLALPLTVGCLLALAGAARAFDNAGEAKPAAPPKSPRSRSAQVTEASEDSFPASDPPSWTPMTGPGTRH